MALAAPSVDLAVIVSAVHQPSRSRPCVHLLGGAVPDVLLFDRAAVSRLNFQPRITPPPWAAIASRRGDLLTVSFDRAGPVQFCHHSPGTPGRRFHYRLTEIHGSAVTGVLTEAVQ